MIHESMPSSMKEQCFKLFRLATVTLTKAFAEQGPISKRSKLIKQNNSLYRIIFSEFQIFLMEKLCKCFGGRT